MRPATGCWLEAAPVKAGVEDLVGVEPPSAGGVLPPSAGEGVLPPFSGEGLLPPSAGAGLLPPFAGAGLLPPAGAGLPGVLVPVGTTVTMVRVTVLVSVTGTIMVDVPETTVLVETVEIVNKGF